MDPGHTLPPVLRPHVRVNGAHWLWTGPVHPKGRHPRLYVGKKEVSPRRLAWAAVYEPAPPRRRVRPACGQARCLRPVHLRLDPTPRVRGRQRKLTDEEAAQLLAARAAGASLPMLARRFNLNVGAVWHIVRGDTYRDVASNGHAPAGANGAEQRAPAAAREA